LYGREREKAHARERKREEGKMGWRGLERKREKGEAKERKGQGHLDAILLAH